MALIRELGMQDCVQVIRILDRPNIRLSVLRIDADPAYVYGPLIQRLRHDKNECPRVVVYCSRIDLCTLLYTTFHQALGDCSYFPPSGQKTMRNRLFASFHSGCTENAKQYIVNSLQQPDGLCRVMFATSALGMGVDVKGLSTEFIMDPQTSWKNTNRNR